MFIQSGEWDTILRVKLQVKDKIFKSLRFQIVVLLILISSIPCLMVKGAVLRKYEDKSIAWRTAEIQNQCTILANQLANSNYFNVPISEVLDAEMAQLSNIYDGRVLIINEDYRVVKDTFGIEDGKTILSPYVITCFTGKSTSNYNKEGRCLDITSPITMADKDETKVIGVILVSISTDIIAETISELKDTADTISGVMMLVIITITAFVMTYMVKPFERLAKRIDEATEGYTGKTVFDDTYTETKNISEALNKMFSRMKVLDESRNEFVSNVSHELKTPLTSMKVLADSLLAQEDVPVELYQEFMGDITEEIERENKIINDLLSLVKMDKTAADLNVKSENINDLVERILKRLRPIAALRNVEVVFESFRPVTAEVDEVKFSLAVSNLVENAIKYNKENGSVHVSLNADHKYFYIKVADSGMGIPEESLEHIFERFYRVDKSHSREIGGTGLGLAIARSAVVMHRGAIKVHSEEGEGTTFTIRVPLNFIA